MLVHTGVRPNVYSEKRKHFEESATLLTSWVDTVTTNVFRQDGSMLKAPVPVIGAELVQTHR